MNSLDRRIIFVQGTTASGKSDWALRLAQKFKGVIFNCDSIQVYKKLDIGSAKPSVQERALLPHYLFDYVSAPNEMTAGQYARDFEEALKQVPVTTPIFVVGGTGFYFMAIEKGMYPVQSVSEDLRLQVEKEIQEEGGAGRLWKELREKDPEYATKLHEADHYRLGRAIEMIRSGGKSVTEVQAEFKNRKSEFPYPLLKIAPRWEREELADRIQKRTDKMLSSGLIEEVQGLLDEGLESWAPLQSVGYREVLEYLSGKISREDLSPRISQGTRQLAKKQRTWFQRDSEIQWFDGKIGWSNLESRVEEFLGSLTQ